MYREYENHKKFLISISIPVEALYTNLGVGMIQTTGLEKMVSFIVGGGGLVRFDRYMQEHILGENGFYSVRAEISKDGHFTTKSLNPAFAHLIYLMLKEEGLADKDFLEIGGGNWSFKRDYLQHSPSTRYISVDASAKLASEQIGVGGTAIIGNVNSLLLPSASIDGVVFSNELMDELPARVLKVRNRYGEVEIVEEGFVALDGNRLKFEYKEAERDEFLGTYEDFLNEQRPDIANGSVISVSQMTQTAISEMSRVLKRGRIMIIDYGYWDKADPKLERKLEELPFFRKDKRFHSVDTILRNPYETDLTYNVDFDFIRWVAEKNGLSVHKFGYQDIIFRRMMISAGVSGPDYSRLLYPGNFAILELGTHQPSH